eukprot:1161297-Pelagomonas_calceolata.AAC.6
MALWAVARLLEAGHNQLGASMAPLRLFRAVQSPEARALDDLRSKPRKMGCGSCCGSGSSNRKNGCKEPGNGHLGLCVSES